MPAARTHAEILRAVAIIAVKEARAAQATAEKTPTAEHLRAAYYACIFARRALLRGSEVNPDDEEAMIELSMLFGEHELGFQTRLVRLELAREA